MDEAKTIGSLFAGIGGFDLGFERAGWKTEWQVEINPAHRLVLEKHFPNARRFGDIRNVTGSQLGHVDCITAGFPCTDFTRAGNCAKRKGLQGTRSGLWFEALRIIREVKPTWLVLENVPDLFTANGGRDFETILGDLADSGYVGLWRLLDAAGFGLPQRRIRLFLVAGLGRYPTLEFLADSRPMVSVPSTLGALEESRPEMAFAGNTLTASDVRCRINLGHEVLICEVGRRSQMVNRQRSSRLLGIPLGLDERNLWQRYGAGNAVPPPVAEWVARKLNQS